MDELLTRYSNEQLLSELEKGHYWYYGGSFYSNREKLKNERMASVENAVFFRFYN